MDTSGQPINQLQAIVMFQLNILLRPTFGLFLLLAGFCFPTDLKGQAPLLNSRNASEELSNQERTSPQLSFSSPVISIFEDSQGRLWFGSQKNGVCVLDGEHINYFTVEDGLSDNQIRTIQEDQAGDLWFATGNGITSYDGQRFEIRSLHEESPYQFRWKAAGPIASNDLWFHADDSVRKGTDGQGVFRFNGQSLSYFALPQAADSRNPNLVTSITHGHDGKVWIGTYPAVFRFDGETFTAVDFGNLADQVHVRSILEDSQKRLWIGNNGLGVLMYNGEQVINFSEKRGLSIQQKGEKGSLGRVFAIAEDQAGNIWFGTRDNGAWRFDGEQLENFTTQDGLTNKAVFAIHVDQKNRVWFGMGDGRVCCYNGRSIESVY